jgi:hypothetical protein
MTPKKPEVQAADVRDDDVDRPFSLQDSMDLPKRLQRVMNVFQHGPEGNDVERIFGECGILDLSLKHLNTQAAGSSNGFWADIHPIDVPPDRFHGSKEGAASRTDIQDLPLSLERDDMPRDDPSHG